MLCSLVPEKLLKINYQPTYYSLSRPYGSTSLLSIEDKLILSVDGLYIL
jgi:hypothetical protein